MAHHFGGDDCTTKITPVMIIVIIIISMITCLLGVMRIQRQIKM